MQTEMGHVAHCDRGGHLAVLPQLFQRAWTQTVGLAQVGNCAGHRYLVLTFSALVLQ